MILSILIIPISMSTFLGNQVLCSSNNEKYMLISVSSGALVNMILNSILIRQFEHNGAAIASVVSESIVMIMEVFFIHKILKIKLDKKIIYTTFLSCFGMVFITINLKRIINNIFISLLISTSCGILVYIIIFYILYPKYVLDMLEKIFGKKLKILNRGQ